MHQDGSIQLQGDIIKKYSHHKYCVETIEENYTLNACIRTLHDDGINELYPICKHDSINTLDWKSQLIKFIFKVMLLSVPFLLVTLGIYAFFKELRNIHGKCFMCCITGLIFFYLSFAIIQLQQEKLLLLPWLCKITGCIAYVSTMICFFWLNVMGYDIWLTFRFVVRFYLSAYKITHLIKVSE